MFLIIVGPSAVGKSTMIKQLQSMGKWAAPVSHTTRQPRPGEVDGVDYYFVTADKFSNLDEYFVYSYNYGNHYGTRKEEVLKWISEGYNIAFAPSANVIKNTITYFAELQPRVVLLTAKRETLIQRLNQRNKEAGSDIEGRIAKAEAEIATALPFADLVLETDDNLTIKERADKILALWE